MLWSMKILPPLFAAIIAGYIGFVFGLNQTEEKSRSERAESLATVTQAKKELADAKADLIAAKTELGPTKVALTASNTSLTRSRSSLKVATAKIQAIQDLDLDETDAPAPSQRRGDVVITPNGTGGYSARELPVGVSHLQSVGGAYH